MESGVPMSLYGRGDGKREGAGGAIAQGKVEGIVTQGSCGIDSLDELCAGDVVDGVVFLVGGPGGMEDV